MFNDIAHFWVVEVTRINVSDTGENGNGPSGRSWDLDIIGDRFLCGKPIGYSQTVTG